MSTAFDYYEWVGDSNETGGTSSDPNQPTFYLTGAPITNVRKWKILGVQIPFTYYVFNDGVDNAFTLSWTSVGPVNNVVSVTIPAGNYSSVTLIPALETALDAASGDVAGTWNVTVDQSTNKMTFARSTLLDYTFTFPSDNTASPMLWLGFTPGVFASFSGSLTTPNVINLTGPNYVYLRSSLAIFNRKSFRVGSVETTGNIIQKIPVNTNPGGLITFGSDGDPNTWYDVGRVDVTELSFWLTGGFGDGTAVMNLNGGAFSVRIGFLRESTNSSANIHMGVDATSKHVITGQSGVTVRDFPMY